MDFNHKTGRLVRQNQPIARLPSGTLIEIPVFSYRAKSKGPTLLLMAGMHGDEINGVEIMRRFIREKLYKIEAGSIVCLPVFNVFGFINFSREVPDGKDVNRTFPGRKTGSLASQFANVMVSEILPHVDIGIDFHTGGKQINNYPQLRTTLEDKENARLATAFHAPFTLNAPYREKSLRKEAAKLEKRILVFEGGESLRLSKRAIEVGIDGTLRLMKALNMIQEAPPADYGNLVIQKSTWLRAKTAGLHHSKVLNGAFLEKKTLLGVISDPYGAHEKKLKTTDDGYVLAINNNPVVNRGDALFHFGTPC